MTRDRAYDVLGKVDDLRRGITTGTCAHAAAQAAAELLVTRKKQKHVSIVLPRGQRLDVPIDSSDLRTEDTGPVAICTVIKDAGDDDDVTHGARIGCEVRFIDGKDVVILGGPGVGRVTRPGLPVPVGEAAINPVPREMIRKSLTAPEFEGRGFSVTVFVEHGAEIAQRTWNPRLGIENGISIIGTTGIVEPKSSAAFKRSVALAIRVAAQSGQTPLYLTPGYLGERVLRKHYGLPDDRIIKVGDHIGTALKHAAVALEHREGPTGIVLIGHIGKLVKVAAGMFNTHSKYGDARLETIAAYAGAHGASPDVIREILNLELAEASVQVLRAHGLEAAFESIAESIHSRCLKRVDIDVDLTVILLSLDDEILATYRSSVHHRETGEASK